MYTMATKFQILNNENIPMTMQQLDESAAEFWGVEISDSYVAPKGYYWACSWFDYIGAAIAACDKDHLEWSDVIGHLCGVMAICESKTDSYLRRLDALKPFLDLIFHWKELDYTPRCILD